MKLPTLLASAALPLLVSSPVHADAPVETTAERDARMQWLNDARFGMFIHWGLYSKLAGSWDGKEVEGYGEWIQDRAKIPHNEYRAALLDKFNPVKYDPEAWVLAAKNAGVKYIVITSKHHDGFCLFDSKLTDWDIASTPYGKDLLKPLAEACKKHGIKFCTYYSIMDWGNKDWGTKTDWCANADNPKPDMDAYTAYMKGQLKELHDSFGDDLGVMWFDGEWEDTWTHERGVDLYDYLRELQPSLIINNRVDKARGGMKGDTTNVNFRGDYGTPEQEIPAAGLGKGVAWESCMTMNDTWGFKTNDHNWKSTERLVHDLVDIASKGGNYLLNVGPTAEGEIPAASLERLAAIGEWMKVNGDSIYGTTASLFNVCTWDGRSTTRTADSGETRIYAQIFNKPESGKLIIGGLIDKPQSATILGQSEKLAISGEPEAWTVQLPANLPDPIATVVALDFKKVPAIKQAAMPEPEKKKEETPKDGIKAH